MKKISVGVILLAGVLTAVCFWAVVSPQADDNAVVQGNNLKDEGYGNSDEEYYNSQDDVTNVEEPSGNVTK